MRVLPILAVAAVISGCGGWTHRTASEADFYRDRYACETGSASAYPVTSQAMGTGYQAPARTNCTSWGTQTNCTTTPGAYTPPPAMDVNVMARASAFNSCMRGKGYTYK
jgi:hypothetical protein